MNELMKLENMNLPSPQEMESMAAAMAEEMEGLSFSFDRIKIPSGGGLAFEVPGDDPDSPDLEKEIVGVIVDHHPVNAYWETDYTGENSPPDCSSMDGKQGDGVPGGSCKTCPMNQYAEDGSGKLCKNMHRIYILRQGDMMPLLLTLPPTSLKNFSNYMAKRLLTKGLRSYGVLTKVALKKAQSGGGITYSQAVFALAGKLDPEAAGQMKDYAGSIKPLTRQFAIVDDETSAPAGVDPETGEILGQDIPF